MKKLFHSMLWAAILVGCAQTGQQIGAWQMWAGTRS